MKRGRGSEPSVVVFKEPGKTKTKAFIKRQKFSQVNQNPGRRFTTDNEEAHDGVNFKEIAREVREFGATGFTKKDQRKFQQQKAQSLGAKAPKKQKVPYPILMRAKKIREQRESEQKQLEIAMGIFKKKKSQKPKNDLPISIGRWVDQSKGLETGKYKKGIQKLHQKDIARFKKKK